MSAVLSFTDKSGGFIYISLDSSFSSSFSFLSNKFASSYICKKSSSSYGLSKLIFNGLTPAVAFADFFMSMMAFTAFFTYAAKFDWQLWIQIDKEISKNAPNQADNFTNFSVMPFTENQLFDSSIGSDFRLSKCHLVDGTDKKWEFLFQTSDLWMKMW